MKSGLGTLPNRDHLATSRRPGALGGIGFTVSLVITNLAFDDANLADIARIGIFAGSLIVGLLGSILLRTAPATGDVGPQTSRSPPRITRLTLEPHTSAPMRLLIVDAARDKPCQPSTDDFGVELMGVENLASQVLACCLPMKIQRQ